MPDLTITSCKDHNNADIEDAVVIALSQDDLHNNILHSAEGSDFPIMSFLRCNLTDASGQCVITVAGGSLATVSFVTDDADTGTDCKVHITMAS